MHDAVRRCFLWNALIRKIVNISTFKVKLRNKKNLSMQKETILGQQSQIRQ